MYIYTYINKTVIRNYAENANEISNPKNTTSRQTKVIIRFVRFHFAFHSDNSGPIPFLFSRGQNIRWLVQRQTWRLDVSARLQMSTPPQGSQHRRGIVMGYESSPGQLYQQLSPSYYLIYKSTSGTFNIGQVAMRLTAPSFNIKSWHALEGSSAGLLWLGTLVNHAQVLVFSSSLSQQSKSSRTYFEPDVPLMHASIELLLSMK